MIMRAALALQIRREDSFLIGDMNRDIQAGRTAGLSTIGLTSSKKLIAELTAELVCENLFEASELILRYNHEDPG